MRNSGSADIDDAETRGNDAMETRGDSGMEKKKEGANGEGDDARQ